MATLQVFLGNTLVGWLTHTTNGGGEFRLAESYKMAYPRPILGQIFLDDLAQVYSSRNRIPAWFSNLLPEGILKQIIVQQLGVNIKNEFQLIHHLGHDLPGAVRMIPEENFLDSEFHTDSMVAAEAIKNQNLLDWHFSLAGVQLKFSAMAEGKGLTIPAHGMGGDWIIKLPDQRYPHVPENEFATMSWAQASGINVPEFKLVPTQEIAGLPLPFIQHYQKQASFAIRRFDRLQNQDGNSVQLTRVHIEDFAQVLGVYPERKYDETNYETLAKISLALLGESGLRDFIYRLVFVIISGNGDAHLKNWSLIYTQPDKAELSPAYDFVSVIQYNEYDKLALNLAKSKEWEKISIESFTRLARKIGFSEKEMEKLVLAAISQIIQTWHHSGKSYYSATQIDCLNRHMQRVPLLQGFI